MKPGDTILIPFPFTDLSSTKLRPAVVLSIIQVGSDRDIILACVSSRTEHASKFDIVVDSNHPEFATTGFKVSSVILARKLVTLLENLAVRRLGSLGSNLQSDLNSKLKALLNLS